MVVRILTGDVRERIAELPDESVHCVVTSPPYYGLRDYNVPGQIGLEPTLAEYIDTMTAVFRDVRRVLRSDGVCFLNVGDSFVDKQLQMVPARLALALQADGWWLRSDIIWAKPNPMPESVQGSQCIRHRVTIGEYERLSRLPYSEQRNDQDRAGNVPGLQAREILGSETPVSAEREGQGDSSGTGRTRGRAGEASSVQPVGTRATQQEEVRSDAQRQSDASEGDCEVSPERSREDRGIVAASSDQRPPATDRTKATGEREVRQDREDGGEETTGLCTTEAGNRSFKATNGSGLDDDSRSAWLPLSLLQDPIHGGNPADVGSRDSGQQGRAARSGEHRPGLPAVQFQEGQQDNSTLLVHCPGCHECEATNGYILRLNAGRPTSAHEHIFLLTKSARYWYDADAVREAAAPDSSRPSKYGTRITRKGAAEGVYHVSDAMPSAHESMIAKDPNGANLRNVWSISTVGFNGWSDAKRRVDVTLDDVDDDTIRTTSPDCPVHGGSLDPAPTGSRGGHTDALASDRNHGTYARLDLGLELSPAPIALTCDEGSAAESSDSARLACADSATDRSNQVSKTAPVPATTQPCTSSAQTQTRTEYTSVAPSTSDSADHKRESSNESDDSPAHPSLQTPSRTVHNPSEYQSHAACTCSYHKIVTESISHFATFPPEIPRRCIKAGTSEHGCCSACGAPWSRVVERLGLVSSGPNQIAVKPRSQNRNPNATPLEDRNVDGYGDLPKWDTRTVGWQPGCTCDADVIPCTVLDPFFGSGTTGLVADQLGRDCIGIELNPAYALMSQARIQESSPMFAQVTA